MNISVLRDSLKIALVVGTFLCLFNQYEAIWNLHFSPEILFKLFMNFLTPFAVSAYSKFQFLKKNKTGKTQAETP